MGRHIILRVTSPRPTTAPAAVFVSYAREDSDAARRLAGALRGHGVEVWFDQDELRGGEAWDQKLRRQIKECALFVPVVSANTQERREGYFRLEWKLASERTHLMAEGVPFIAPVVIDETKEADALVPAEFMRVQWTRLPGARVTPEFAEQVKRLLGPVEVARVSRPVGSGNTGQETRATPKVGRRVPAAAWGLASVGLLAVAVIVAWQVRKSLEAGAGASPPIEEKSALATPAAAVVSKKSIAVLPFENMSDDKKSGYFADGVQEEVITNLTFIPGLKVVPQPTAMRYRDSKKTIRQIAEELGVAYVLLGTVRSSEGQVRVTGRLMNGRTEEQVWIKPYQKDLTDVFAIQAALATEIAGALSAVISPEAQKLIRRVPTENAAAYDKYLQARELMSSGAGLVSAPVVALLQEAVDLDSKFAVAWAWLSKSHGLAYLANRDHTPERLAKAKAAIDLAVKLAPDDPDVVYNLGYFYYHEGRNYSRALEQMERGARLQPGSAIWNFGTGGIERRMGKWAESLANFRRAAEIDPGNVDHVSQVIGVAMAGRRYDDALPALQRLAELLGGRAHIELAIAQLPFLRDGSTREMAAFFAASNRKQAGPLWRSWNVTLGNFEEIIRSDARAPASVDNAKFEAALCLAASGNLTTARERIAGLAPPLRDRLKAEPENADVWGQLGCIEALLGNTSEALRCARKSVDLIPETSDAWVGPGRRAELAFVYAWTGDKGRAIAEYARLLRTPGADIGRAPFLRPNIHVMKRHPAFFPLQGDPRFQALLDDPKNNAPLF